MAFWNVDNVDKPWGKFDRDGNLDIPFSWTAWLADVGRNYSSHQIIVSLPLELIASQQAGGVITAFIRVAAGQTAQLNQKYPVTCRITTDGNPPLKDDRTVWLKMMDR